MKINFVSPGLMLATSRNLANGLYEIERASGATGGRTVCGRGGCSVVEPTARPSPPSHVVNVGVLDEMTALPKIR